MRSILPAIGFGTYTLTDRAECIETVVHALETGYRHVDTAYVYENESLVGEAIDRADVDSEDVVVATKLWWGRLGYDDAIEMAEASRDRLGVDSIDLLYVHWPIDTYDPAETLPALDELVDRGVIEHVGFCNCSTELLAEAEAGLDAPLAVHQVECHPLFPQNELLAYANERGHELVAAVPLMKGAVADVPVLRSIAEAYDATPAQVSIAWQIRRGVTPIPKGRGAHAEENYAALELADELDSEDVARIDEIEDRKRIVEGWPGAHWRKD